MLVTPNPFSPTHETPLDEGILDPIWRFFHPPGASSPDMPPVASPPGGSQLPANIPVSQGGLLPDNGVPPGFGGPPSGGG